MEPLIYFPTFEPPSSTWLKFSLLYFESFRPIVPYSKRHYLSDDFRRVHDNTDLVNFCEPDYNDGNTASLLAIEEAEKILSRPLQRSTLFNRANVVRQWQDPMNWTFELCREKFTQSWETFCNDMQIGFPSDNGILLPEELAFIFMTYLAKQMALKESAAIITDNNSFDGFTHYAQSFKPSTRRRIDFAKGVVNFQVPTDIAEINIDRLVDFRNNNRNLISAFNTELDVVQDKIANGYTPSDFVDSYRYIYNEMKREMLTIGAGTTAVPFGFYFLTSNPVATSPEYITEIMEALALTIGGYYTVRKGLRDTKTKRLCKKYLTNLKHLE